MPFGISLTPEEFESNLQEKLADLEGVEVIRDDIIVMGFRKTQEQAVLNHDENLIKLLEGARKVNLRLNSLKMELRKAEVKFMGHVFSKEGLKPDPAKVKAVGGYASAIMQTRSVQSSWVHQLSFKVSTATRRCSTASKGPSL